MKYNFDKITERLGTYSCKWEVSDGELPMWIADMDFETAPAIKRAVAEIAEHGIYGYSTMPDEFFEALSKFRWRRYGHRFSPDEAVFSTGVVAALSSLVRKLTTPAENMIRKRRRKNNRRRTYYAENNHIYPRTCSDVSAPPSFLRCIS